LADVKLASLVLLAAIAFSREAWADPRSGGPNGDLGREPDVELPEADDEPVAPHREVVTTYHTGALASGIVLLGFNWVLGLVVARAEVTLADRDTPRPEARNNPLMAPLVGPFIALGTDDERPGGEIALLLVNGIAQLGGLALVTVGLSFSQRHVVEVSLGPGGASLSGRF
jgi:hypothetical protein